MKTITISQLTGYIKEKLESDLVLSNLWVKGEISNFKHHSSGHMYFTLKDRTSALRCIMFRSRNNSLNFLPTDGMAVIARGSVTVYERDGQYQLYVEEMQPDGTGALFTAYLQLKAKLEREGFFSLERKRPLPGFPHKVGVVTSPTGAAIRDIITVMQRRYPSTNIIIIPVKVQGDDAPQQIAEGIRLANKLKGMDVIIVGRGGGSIEELWAFNTELVARSIYESRVPVISAVGHETDFTIADFVADQRAPTPSAAAEIVVPDWLDLQKNIKGLNERLIIGVRGSVAAFKEKITRLNNSNVLKRPKDNLHNKMIDLDYLTRRLGQIIVTNLDQKKNGLALQASRLSALSPLATICRGYSICRDKQGLIVKKAISLTPGDNIELIMIDGTVECDVRRVKEGYYGQKKK